MAGVFCSPFVFEDFCAASDNAVLLEALSWGAGEHYVGDMFALGGKEETEEGEGRGAADSWLEPLPVWLVGAPLVAPGLRVETEAGVVLLEKNQGLHAAVVCHEGPGLPDEGVAVPLRMALLLGASSVSEEEKEKASQWVTVSVAPSGGAELQNALPSLIVPLVSRANLAQNRLPLPAEPGLEVDGRPVSALLPGGLCVDGTTGALFALTADAKVSGTRVFDGLSLLSTGGGKKRWLVHSGSAVSFVDSRKLPGAGNSNAMERDDHSLAAGSRRRLARLPAAEAPPSRSQSSAATGPALMAAPVDANGLQQLLGEILQAVPDGLRRSEKKRAKGKKLKKPVLQAWEGAEGVSWLMQHKQMSRVDAVQTLQQMLLARMIYNVADPWSARPFQDDTDLWRFQCDGPAPPLNVRISLAPSVSARPPIVVARLLLESVLQLVRPFVRLAGNPVPELDYFRLRELPRWAAFETGTCELQRVSLAALESEQEKLAFWINVHNCLCVHASVCNKGLVNGGWAGGFFTEPCYLLECSTMSLHQIHSGILRSNMTVAGATSPALESTDPMVAHVLPSTDPRVLFALSGCYRDSPPVRVCEPGSLDDYLTTATRDYLDQRISWDFATCSVTLPGIMQPFLRDFGKDYASVLMWTSKFLPPEKRQIVAFLSQQPSTAVKFSDVNFDVFPPRL